jgi:hypothetical protein
VKRQKVCVGAGVGTGACVDADAGTRGGVDVVAGVVDTMRGSGALGLDE